MQWDKKTKVKQTKAQESCNGEEQEQMGSDKAGRMQETDVQASRGCAEGPGAKGDITDPRGTMHRTAPCGRQMAWTPLGLRSQV